jgi:hypothetical protein
MKQIDHLIEAFAKEIGGDGNRASGTPRKQTPLNINAGVLNIGNDPES